MTGNLSIVCTFDFVMCIMHHIKESSQDEGCQACGAVYDVRCLDLREKKQRGNGG
jgi:hypothetical protein